MQKFTIHSKTPQERLTKQIADRLMDGEIGAIPTDSGYSLISSLDNSKGRERIIQIRSLDENHFFTLLCAGLADLSTYANVNNANFKLIKRLIPGPYTFILPITREVPKRLAHPKRKTIGIRSPDSTVIRDIINWNKEPLMSVSLSFLELTKSYENSSEEIAEYLEKHIDFFVDTGEFIVGETTVIDCCQTEPEIIRQGIGEI
jgi:tRNA threonylcarbamoyl adenosine modification protein (Sua5/YciO/YrdC/YwlC family)